MSLQGSFETIALRDVMALLSSSNKSGELRVVGGQVEGRLWMHDGRLVGSKVGKSRGHVDAVFELLRLTEGNFVFKDGVEAPDPGEPTEVEPVMSEAEGRLREWAEIELVVPSLEHRVRLIPELPTAEVTLTAAEWQLVMSIAMAATVRGVLEELALGHFEGCRGIRRLVEAGLVVVEPPRVRSTAPDPARLARRAAVAVGSAGAGGAVGPDVRIPRVVHHPTPPAATNGSAAGLVAAHDDVAMGSFNELSALASVAAAVPESSPSLFEAPDWSSSSSSAAEDEPPMADPHPVHDLDVVRSAPSFPPVAPILAEATSSDRAAVEALRGRWARTQATTHAEESVLMTPEPEMDVAPTWPASSPAPDVVNHAQDGAGLPAGADANDQGGDSINRGLLLKFLSSVRS